jgi:hypothetical protein
VLDEIEELKAKVEQLEAEIGRLKRPRPRGVLPPRKSSPPPGYFCGFATYATADEIELEDQRRLGEIATAPDGFYTFAIWWLSEEECCFVLAHFSFSLPGYILIEVDSMQGRPKRGRLWVPRGFPPVSVAADNPILNTPFIGSRGGIVIDRNDAVKLAPLPGYITDAQMKPLIRRNIL